MNERIKELAEQAGIFTNKTSGELHGYIHSLERFAELVRQDEREVKDKLLDALQEMVKQFTKTPSSLKDSTARVKAHAAIAKATGEQA